MSKPFISLKILDSGGNLVRKVGTKKIRRIYINIQRDEYIDCLFKIFVRYGSGFHNSGEYKSKKDLIMALKAFTEPE